MRSHDITADERTEIQNGEHKPEVYAICVPIYLLVYLIKTYGYVINQRLRPRIGIVYLKRWAVFALLCISYSLPVNDHQLCCHAPLDLGKYLYYRPSLVVLPDPENICLSVGF